MKNWEKYISTDDRVTAFRRYCADIGCANCGLNPYAGAKHTMCVDRCILKWLALEAEDEPLPCPFCGGEADVIPYPATKRTYIECKDCKISTRICDTKSDAIAAWNRRVK